MASPIKKVLIVGGGFGGIAAAKELYHRHLPNVKITLVNPTSYFEYHASLYRVMAGRSPAESSIALSDIFTRGVETVKDLIVGVDFEKKEAHGRGGSRYQYDFLIIGVGAETNYYDIPGIAEFSYSLKSLADAVRLKNHLHDSFTAGTIGNNHIVIVGGGATGVEIAGELASYTQFLAKKHGVDPSSTTVDLVAGSRRLVPQLSPNLSDKIKLRLHELGVNIYLNRYVMKEEVQEIYLKDMKMQTKTVVWAAGTRGNSLLSQVGLPVNESGRVIVNKYLKPNKKLDISFFDSGWSPPSPSAGNPKVAQNEHLRFFKDVFIIGDSAATKYSGLAVTAVGDGKYVADNIVRVLKNQTLEKYHEKKVNSLIPVGPNWGVFSSTLINLCGRLGYFIIRLNRLRFFLSILPVGKALTAWSQDGILWETCPVCRSTK